MNHYGAFGGIGRIRILKLKALRHIEIELNRSHLVIAFERIADIEIDFWAIECAIAWVDFIGAFQSI